METQIDTVLIERHKEVVIATRTLNTFNERLCGLLMLIDPEFYGWLQTTYDEDFDRVEAWIKSRLPVEHEDLS